MDVFMVVFRIIHIGAAVYWVGVGVFMATIMVSAIRGMGAEGDRFYLGFIKHSRFAISMPLAALLTTLSGLALYDRVSDHFNSDWLQSTPGIVLTIGALAGLAAFGHGAGAIGRTTGRYAAAVEATYGSSKPTAQQLETVRQLRDKTAVQARTSALIQVIALVGMAAARYV